MAAVICVKHSKFRGCLLGVLFGDSLGTGLENKYMNMPVPSLEFEQFSKEKLSELKAIEKPFHFTSDSAMTMALCRSLLAEKSFNINHLARQYVETYFREPLRGYGRAVVTVFDKLRTRTLEDVTLPAREQFGGRGSYGNGAAMRVSPLALFYHNDLDELRKTSRQNALITHAHALGVHGAILQAVAVYESLHTPPGTLDVGQYIEKIIVTAQKLEQNEEKAEQESKDEASLNEEGERHEESSEDRQSYVTQFQHIKRMLVESEGDPNTQHVIDKLGHGIKAVEAVPAAIFAFLCKSDTCFEDVIFYAISLGGDTDTIACMAGAIAGAYWGDEQIPEEWYPVTEGVDEITKYADELHDLRVGPAGSK